MCIGLLLIYYRIDYYTLFYATNRGSIQFIDPYIGILVMIEEIKIDP